MTDLDIAMTRTGAGEPVVLLHGIGHRRQAWDPIIELLATDYEVIAVDLPGFGESPGLPPALTYDMATTIENFAQTFADLGLDRPHVVGNSLGGAIALELGAQDLVRSVTALSPGGFWKPYDRKRALLLLGSLRMSAMVPESTLRRIAHSPRLRAQAMRQIVAHPERLTDEQFVADALCMARSPGYKPTARAAAKYDCHAVPVVPTTIAWGTRDRVLPPRQAAIARRRLPAARHLSLPGCGHVPMIDDPELIVQVIRLGVSRQDAAA
ncbi:alpha/beta fold hydrolase [Solicola gregarius]|uniref:Alpha/beta hydrolase n=1 Tax=Solicola gregarius TaxID=2908642 RepID=A0AA46TKX0_9ACTN|nr:alpha/beta hydrolase [Solicola gregarius]UYM07192.1 alpha/beta hydrolase [Solicola gregarius]